MLLYCCFLYLILSYFGVWSSNIYWKYLNELNCLWSPAKRFTSIRCVIGSWKKSQFKSVDYTCCVKNWSWLIMCPHVCRNTTAIDCSPLVMCKQVPLPAVCLAQRQKSLLKLWVWFTPRWPKGTIYIFFLIFIIASYRPTSLAVTGRYSRDYFLTCRFVMQRIFRQACSVAAVLDYLD